ncbi:conserved hypothetical protein [Candida tropicalis MYA-3404]|uniref:Uncharacterized protein n=1 Tax=Candida tropicalis (strain ATCC MYA-3404 / T1) TaxID=294747 RepID=C5MB40_CANTT|nr:conserved hypothetical protein [Candida tropicalis MYA-3404]EER32856.1 conserved hypothetical protein [Candida tropicalis MYA-3404]KAG4406684.1 hypothetical protein JTP64_004068 [Candida tropicalis]
MKMVLIVGLMLSICNSIPKKNMKVNMIFLKLNWKMSSLVISCVNWNPKLLKKLRNKKDQIICQSLVNSSVKQIWKSFSVRFKKFVMNMMMKKKLMKIMMKNKLNKMSNNKFHMKVQMMMKLKL